MSWHSFKPRERLCACATASSAVTQKSIYPSCHVNCNSVIRCGMNWVHNYFLLLIFQPTSVWTVGQHEGRAAKPHYDWGEPFVCMAGIGALHSSSKPQLSWSSFMWLSLWRCTATWPPPDVFLSFWFLQQNVIGIKGHPTRTNKAAVQWLQQNENKLWWLHFMVLAVTFESTCTMKC